MPITKRKEVMPFTPFHLGPALFFGLALSMIFDLPTFLVANVIPDLEPFYVAFFHVRDYPLHGFFHSYLGASILAVLTAVLIYPLRGGLNKILAFFGVSQKYSFKKIIFTSFVGAYFHVFLDSFLYGEMNPFYPLIGNPFVGLLHEYGAYSVIYGFCSLAGLLGIILYLYKIVKVKLKRRMEKE